ncbi:dTDP-4-dehydrorhamnose reductase [Parafrankia irregularis]|uniref:dTDP-4-dehydrorhamnose reductase n=1 Tax=Parafrankia irregularis TaxID=795642 RepID=A0A0S4QF17_9ACTN|nr:MULTISPECIES: SDR family oxidoreductase [Parafrankia]MBE3199468.1 SDR family oxidoreductase [Parafrankia sp. CH37]CUU53870.1 dTDP-4-dehydrorhamnose reductase [Parafrankia irregularis]
MRVLVLGGDGMLGGELVRRLVRDHDVTATVRAHAPSSPSPADRVLCGVDVCHPESLVDVFAETRPDAVVNAVGLTARRVGEQGMQAAIEVNALFPHRLARLCGAAGARLVHVSSDCVFSGRLGEYHEDDVPDPVDAHGMTKLLGELTEPGTLTLRTSVLGLETAAVPAGLVEWFLSATGRIPGYRRVVYSGVTTAEFARFVHLALVGHPDLSGVWHLASEPITKFDLLTMLADRLGRHNLEIVPSDDEVRNRALSARRLWSVTGYRPPAWAAMVDELATAIERREIEGSRRGSGHVADVPGVRRAASAGRLTPTSLPTATSAPTPAPTPASASASAEASASAGASASNGVRADA